MLNRLDHTTLMVDDLEESVDWYSDLVGLKVLDRSDERVLLSAADDHVDLTLVPGGSGLRDFAFGVADSATLASYEQRLSDAGVSVERPEDTRPGVEERIRFALPSSHVMEIQTGAAGRAAGIHRDTGWDGSVGPLDICHVNLVTDDPDGLSAFLSAHLDFKETVNLPAPDGSGTFGIWTHTSDYHHDVAFMKMPNVDAALHHVAFVAGSFEHIGVIADSLYAGGTTVEFGPGRHPDANLFMYALDPSGNRIEWAAGLPIIPFDSEVALISADTPLDVWSHRVPESFFVSSTAAAV